MIVCPWSYATAADPSSECETAPPLPSAIADGLGKELSHWISGETRRVLSFLFMTEIS